MRIIPFVGIGIIFTLFATLIISIIDHGWGESWFLILIIILIFLPGLFDKLPRRGGD